jgi:hypothetical protein
MSNNKKNMYVIKNDDTGKFIAIDNSSGGYPYDTEIHNAKFWHDKDDAFRYKNVFKNEKWSLHTISFEIEKCDWFEL